MYKPVNCQSSIFESMTVPKSFIELVLGWENCNRCPLHRNRHGKALIGTQFKSVFLDGKWQEVPQVIPIATSVVAVGQSPGSEEVKLGHLFVGPEGMNARRKLCGTDSASGAYVGMHPENVYWTNVLACRQPEGMLPDTATGQCMVRVKELIAILRPRIIVLIGAYAAQSLLGTMRPLATLRGLVHKYDGIPTVAVTHPAYVNRLRRMRADVDVIRDAESGVKKDVIFVTDLYNGRQH